MTDADRNGWDASVIGSGIGGMAAGAALSKLGHKVLLLEQYQTLDGLTHSFSMDGFAWDAGIHYLNCVAPGDRERDILDWLADAPIGFTSMGTVYDNLHIGDAAPLSLSRPYEAQERDLKDRFPDEARAIEAWIAALKEGREAVMKVTPDPRHARDHGPRSAMVARPRHRPLVQADNTGGDRRNHRQS